jgi:hypothetical protein
LPIPALDNDDEFILPAKICLIIQKISMVTLSGPHQIATRGIEFQVCQGPAHTNQKTKALWIDEPTWGLNHGMSQSLKACFEQGSVGIACHSMKASGCDQPVEKHP